MRISIILKDGRDAVLRKVISIKITGDIYEIKVENDFGSVSMIYIHEYSVSRLIVESEDYDE